MLQKAYQGKNEYIFISYSHKDKNNAFKFIEKLQEKFNVWYDEGIHFGKEWDQEIEQKLAKCKVFMFLISPNSISSENCMDEINYARIKNKPFINVLLEKTNISDDFLLRYGRYQMLKAYDKSLDENLKSLEDSIPQIKETYKIELLDNVISKKKSKKKRIILSISSIIILLLLATGGILFWYLNTKSKPGVGEYSFNNIKIDGDNLLLRISSENETYDLKDEINTSGNAKWYLYSDKECENEIFNKVASINAGPLNNGNNYFYLKIHSNDNDELYKLNIYKYYDVTINYVINDEIYKTVKEDSGINYQLDKDITLKGYTFNNWKYNDEIVTNIYLEEDITLIGDVIWELYNVKIDSNYSNLFINNEFDLHYGDSLNIGVVEEEGYDFLGWESNGILISDNNGYINNYNLEEDCIISPKFQPKKYNINYIYDELIGEIGGPKTPSYNYDIKVNGSCKAGYECVGLKVDGTEILNDEYSFKMPSHDVEIELLYSEIHKDFEDNYRVDVDKITYGYYPQSLETDSEIINALNNKSGSTPTDDDPHNWIAFDVEGMLEKYVYVDEYSYYTDGYEFKKMAYYIDIDLDNDGIYDYRGIYQNYNLGFICESINDIYIDLNYYEFYENPYGYLDNNTYWFKYEPITWTIWTRYNEYSIVDCYALSDIFFGKYMRGGYYDFSTVVSNNYINPKGYNISIYSKTNDSEYQKSLSYKRHENENYIHTDYIKCLGSDGNTYEVNNGLMCQNYLIRYYIHFIVN